MSQSRSGASRGCWIDLFEVAGFQGKLRRLFGPGAYPALRGQGTGVRIGSVVTGPQTYALFYQNRRPQNGVWIMPDEHVADLAARSIGEELDSMKLLNRPPLPGEPEHSSFPQSTPPPPA